MLLANGVNTKKKNFTNSPACFETFYSIILILPLNLSDSLKTVLLTLEENRLGWTCITITQPKSHFQLTSWTSICLQNIKFSISSF